MFLKSRSEMFFVLVLFFWVAWLGVAAQPQETARTLEKVPLKNEPVEIAEAKVGSKSVSLGQSFIANNDWLSDLSFKVKNLSAKPIVRIEVELQFPEVAFHKGGFVLSIHYGQVPDLPDSGPKEQVPVEPNETVQMQLDSDTHGGLKSILTANGRTFGVTKARVRFSMIIFADGTAWRNGFLLDRDPNNPRRWIRISNNIGRIKTPSRTMGFFVSTQRRRFPSVASFTGPNNSFNPGPLPSCNVRYIGTAYVGGGFEYCSTGGGGGRHFVRIHH